jgi:catechol 2,3-dioxygenase-like lactoylglutathione lyase family enzyme
MLADCELEAMVATAQPDRARAFYGDTLGLTFVADTPFALIFRAGRTTVRIQKVPQFTPLPFTTFGWKVPDIGATVAALAANGVTCEHFDGLPQDPGGIWQSPNGDRVAWFKDPDGNLLSLAQPA